MATDDADATKVQAKSSLKWAALFLGELRDGLTMINMQSAFLIVSKGYSEKQAGILFFVFGMSQFLFQTPAGYLFDYTHAKMEWLSLAALSTTGLTLLTALFATNENLPWMIFVKFLQGAVTSFIPPGLNSITQGIVGSSGMTTQVASNEMMNHLGTAVIVLSGSGLGYWLYPNLGLLFLVSPVACLGFLISLHRIPSSAIDHAAARGLESTETEAVSPAKTEGSEPSFAFYTTATKASKSTTKADSPWRVLRDPLLLTFLIIVFLFHTANGTVLPLVMQTLALGGGRSGIVLSGLCIIVAQMCMVAAAHVCGQWKGGRKPLFLTGLFTVPVRCLLLYGLTTLRDADGENGSLIWPVLILATQLLDGVGAGVFGTLYILVTSDISGGTGRFSLTLGLTTAAMSIGGTVSGYLGQALAQDWGYRTAFLVLAGLSTVPAVLYLTCMPETRPSEMVKAEPVDSIPEGKAVGSETNYGRLV